MPESRQTQVLPLLEITELATHNTATFQALEIKDPSFVTQTMQLLEVVDPELVTGVMQLLEIVDPDFQRGAFQQVM